MGRFGRYTELLGFHISRTDFTDYFRSLMDNPECEEVLTARYLEFKDWTTIARELNYCKDWVFRLHRKGLHLVNADLVPH